MSKGKRKQSRKKQGKRAFSLAPRPSAKTRRTWAETKSFGALTVWPYVVKPKGADNQ